MGELSNDRAALDRDGVLTSILLAVLVLLALAHALWFAPPGYVDDAYISLHNASVLLSSDPDPNYAGAPALSGATSAPHVVLLSLLSIALPGSWAAWVAGWFGALLYGLGVFFLLRAFRAPGWLALGGALVALTPASLPYQLVNGLETSLALAGIVWALASATDPRLRRALPWILGLLPFLRPELVAFSGLVGLYEIDRLWRERHATFSRDLLRFAGAVLACAVPWVLLYLINTGSPIPATIGAKKAYFAEGCKPVEWKLAVMGDALGRAAGELGIWLGGLVLSLRTRLGRVLLAFAAVFFASYYVSFPGALTHYELRYMYVLEPILIWGVASTLFDGLPAVRWVSRAILALAVLQAAYTVPKAFSLTSDARDFALTELDGVATWANEHLPADARVMVHDAGYFAYATDFPLIDMVGLKTPDNAAVHQAITGPSCGQRRAAAVSRVARDNGAQYFVLLLHWEHVFHLARGLDAEGWRVSIARRPGAEGYYVLRLDDGTVDTQ